MSHANPHNDLQKSGKYSSPAEIRAEIKRRAESDLIGFIIRIASGERATFKEMAGCICKAERKGINMDEYKDIYAELFLDRRRIYGLGQEDSSLSPIARA